MTARSFRFSIASGVAGLLIGMTAAPCAGTPAPALPPELATADALARTQPVLGLAALNRYAGDTDAITPPVRRALLLRLRRAYLDLGDYAGARTASDKLREFGQRQDEASSVAWATLTDVEEHLRTFQSDKAKVELDRVGRQVNLVALPELAFAVHMAYGRLYLLKAEYENAIEQFQVGVELSPRTEEPASARVEALRNLSYCYLSLDDTGRAYSILEKAMESDDGSLRAHVRGLLYLAKAIVLAELKRYVEAEAAFADALAVSRASGLRVIESRILGDWAELALRRERYTEAESLGRQALQSAEALRDDGVAMTARANIGFALVGQGKVTEGLPYIDAVTEHFRRQGNAQALLSTLDEKGRLLQRQGWYKEAVTVLREQQKLERQQFTEQRSKAVAALQGRFEMDQNLHRIELLEKQSKLKDAEIRNRKLRQVAMSLAVLLMLAVGALLGLLYRRVRRSNTHLQALNSRLAEQAVRDPLTGLYNRRSFTDLMQTRAERAVNGERRSPGEHAGGDHFVMLDLDHFKAVNDGHGHAAGDLVLVELAKRLLATVRDSDTVLRWGGEEFLVYLTDCSAAQSALLAQRLLDAVSNTPFDIGTGTLDVTVSMGMVEMPFAGLPDSECDWQRTLRLADAALYLAKAHGRNRCEQLLPSAIPTSTDLATLESDLNGVITAGIVVLRTISPSSPAGARPHLPISK